MVNRKFRQRWENSVRQKLENEIFINEKCVLDYFPTINIGDEGSRYAKFMKREGRLKSQLFLYNIDALPPTKKADTTDLIWEFLGGNNIKEDEPEKYSNGQIPLCVGNCFRKRNHFEERFD